MTRKLTIPLMIILFLSFSNHSFATESDELSLVVKQLKQIKESLIKSEIVSSAEYSNVRYHFNYSSAHEDINQIISGIERYLSPEREQPRTVLPEINGDYSSEIGN